MTLAHVAGTAQFGEELEECEDIRESAENTTTTTTQQRRRTCNEREEPPSLSFPFLSFPLTPCVGTVKASAVGGNLCYLAKCRRLLSGRNANFVVSGRSYVRLRHKMRHSNKLYFNCYFPYKFSFLFTRSILLFSSIPPQRRACYSSFQSSPSRRWPS